MSDEIKISRTALAQVVQALYNIIEEVKNNENIPEIVAVNAENALLWIGDEPESDGEK